MRRPAMLTPRIGVSDVLDRVVLPGVLILFLSCLSCHASPSAPRPSPPDPSTYAFAPYGDPVWLSDGSRIGFNYYPVDSITLDPTSGSVTYYWIDSLRGWWSISVDGSDQRRHSDDILRSPSLDPYSTRLVATVGSQRGWQLGICPLVQGLPDLAALTLLMTSTEAFDPQWNPTGDSLVYFNGVSPRAARIIAANNTGERFVLEELLFPDWHPTEQRLLGTMFNNTAGAYTSYVLEYDLITGALDTLCSSNTTRHFYPRYSPNATSIAVVEEPLSGNGATSLWLLSSTGEQRSCLVSERIQRGAYAWSPNGDTIAFIRYDLLDFTLGNGTIWIVDTHTTAQRQLTYN